MFTIDWTILDAFLSVNFSMAILKYIIVFFSQKNIKSHNITRKYILLFSDIIKSTIHRMNYL